MMALPDPLVTNIKDASGEVTAVTTHRNSGRSDEDYLKRHGRDILAKINGEQIVAVELSTVIEGLPNVTGIDMGQTFAEFVAEHINKLLVL